MRERVIEVKRPDQFGERGSEWLKLGRYWNSR